MRCSKILLSLGTGLVMLVACSDDAPDSPSPTAPLADGGPAPASPATKLPLVVDAASVAPTTTVTTSTPERYTASIEIPGLGATPVEAGGKTYQRLRISGGGLVSALGKPAVPYITKVLVLPRDENGELIVPAIKVTPGAPVEVTDLDVLPAQPPAIDHSIDEVLAYPLPAFTRDDPAYAASTPYPGMPFDSQITTSGDLDLLVVRIYPVQVNAGGRSASVSTKIDLDVDFNPGKVVIRPATTTDETDVDGSMTWTHDLAPGFVANADVLKNVPRIIPGLLEDPPAADDPMANLVIVAPDAFLRATYPFVTHKRKLGMRVKVFTPPTASGAPTPYTYAALRADLEQNWRNDGILAELTDPDEPGLAPSENIKQVRAYFHVTREHRRKLGVEVVYGAYPTQDQPLEISFATKQASGTITPTHSLTMAKPSANPNLDFSVVTIGGTVATGRAVRVKQGYRFEFESPTAPILPPTSSEIYLRVTQVGTSGTDLAPNDYARVRGRVDIHPWKNLLILGDTDTINTSYDLSEFEYGKPTKDAPKLRVPTDYFYGTFGEVGKDFSPSVHVGRIPVKELADAETALAKIISYEKDDPFARMKPRVALAGEFEEAKDGKGNYDGQADRPFIDTTERVRDYFVARGNPTARAYSAAPNLLPKKFQDGRELPDDLRKPGFAWNAKAADVLSMLNDYQNYIVLHRDHGGAEGWSQPRFVVDDVDDMASVPTTPVRGTLPIVFSINCSTGTYDQETDFYEDENGVRKPNNAPWSQPGSRGYAESLLRRAGGAVAVIAASRISYSGNNDALVDGMFGSIFSDYPKYNPATAPTGETSLGAVMDAGKIMHAWSFLGDDVIVRYYFELFSVFGDPSMRIRRLPR